MAIEACDPDLVPKAPPPPPPAAAPAPPPPPPAPPPAPAPAPQVQKITLASNALFDFDKAVLKPEGKAAIDSEILAKLPQVQKLELVLVTWPHRPHRLGSSTTRSCRSVAPTPCVTTS